ncbi:hypothetical protein ACTHPH_22155 [Paenibacillus pasadenensis]|uniref:hypothetical protein n=1 Tax=Paenibacillus TaxID=44249 RepID=UPI0003F775D5|nr:MULTISPECIES: hypothetical protein [Paenibacillus]QGG54343.1 hypothetical protein GE073_01100 [Paenibacillus sp. B01]
MSTYLKQGWGLTVKHLPIAAFLFLYRLLWGFFLYRLVDSVVRPLVQRYPGADGAASGADAIFWAESQFRLLKTDLAHPYLWLLGGLLLARLLLGPLLSAGLAYSVRHAAESGAEGGTRFLEGIRVCWKPFILLAAAELTLALAPAVWLAREGFQRFQHYSSLPQLAADALPWAGAWLLWIGLLHVLILSLQFGAASGLGAGASFRQALRRLLPLAGVSLVLLLLSGLLQAGVSAGAMAWAGLAAIVIQQGYHFVRTLIDVWILSAQYSCWSDKPDAGGRQVS